MSGWIVAPSGLLIDTGSAPEIYCDQIAAIEDLGGGNICVHYYRENLPLEGGAPQRTVVLKVFRSLSGIPMTIGYLAQCCAPPPSLVPPNNGRPFVVRS